MTFTDEIRNGTRVLVPEHGKRRGEPRQWSLGTVTEAAPILTVSLDDGRTVHVPRGLAARPHTTEGKAEAMATEHDYRVTKCHIDGRRYCAVVIDYAPEARKGAEATRQGRTYPHVYRAARDGWTRETRSDCYAWIRSKGYVPSLVPSDAVTEHERRGDALQRRADEINAENMREDREAERRGL